MKLNIGKEGVSLKMNWLEVYLWGVTASMVLFGLWGLYDGLEIGSARAGWKFIFLFLCFVAPAVATLVFFKPKNTE